MINLPDFDTDEFIERVCDFISEKVKSSNSEGVVIGLSGGIDSAVVASLAVMALGPDKVKAYVLPSLTTADQDIFDVDLLKSELGIDTTLVDITDIHETFLKSCSTGNLPTDHRRKAESNLKPRIRMSILYYYAAIHNSLVIGTGNKTEILLGYFTKYGDGGVDLEPIGDLYKEDVRNLARALGIPDSIINKAPTAGLWPGQTDEDELGMTYPILDRVLYLYFDEEYEIDYVSQLLELPSNEVERIIKMVYAADHKRNMPEILSKYEPVDYDNETYSVYVDDY